MEIVILTTVILAGIALEGVTFAHARRRAEYQSAIADRLARYAGRKLD